MNEFLNPKSMSTPGAAGALMMLIANALCNNFPEFPFRYVALILSFAIGAIVFTATTMKAWERGIYWVVNSLIIFSMGVGATNIAANVAVRQALSENSTSIASTITSVFVGAAFAQNEKPSPSIPSEPNNQATVTTGTNQPKPSSEAELIARIKTLEAQVGELKAANQRLHQQSQSLSTPTSKPSTVTEPPAIPKAKANERAPESFFKKW